MKKKLSNSYAANAQRKYRAHKLKQGLCAVSGCSNQLASANYCQECILKRREYEKRRIRNRKQNGMCAKCAKNEALPTITVCLECWWLNKSYQGLGSASLTSVSKLKQLWEQQGGKCALSGLPLTPGVNASIDHIIPRSKKGTNKISNLQWVLTAVNSFKLNYSVDEMLRICEAIIAHHKKM